MSGATSAISGLSPAGSSSTVSAGSTADVTNSASKIGATTLPLSISTSNNGITTAPSSLFTTSRNQSTSGTSTATYSTYTGTSYIITSYDSGTKWYETPGGKAGIALAVVVFVAAVTLTAFLRLRLHRRKQRGVAEENITLAQVDENGSRSILGEAITKESGTESMEQGGNNSASRTKRWASFRERPFRERYNRRQEKAATVDTAESQSRGITPVAVDKGAAPSIPEQDELILEDIDNSSRNKYRMEDFDVPNMKMALTGPLPGMVGGTSEMDDEAKHSLNVLRNRIVGIREERDRLERIQELTRLERQAQNEIIEAQRRAGAG